jgi:elongation factor P
VYLLRGSAGWRIFIAMSILEYNEILKGRVILLGGEPYEVLDAHVFRKQQRKPVNQTKLRHLITGKVTEQAFHQAEKAEEADLGLKPVKYLYANRGEWWFTSPENPAERFTLPNETVGPAGQFLKPNSIIDANLFNDEIISLRVPIKVDLLVKEAPPAVRGNTAQGGSKQIVLETGATINAPLFVNEGDIVRVNTETGDYVERVDKK